MLCSVYGGDHQGIILNFKTAIRYSIQTYTLNKCDACMKI